MISFVVTYLTELACGIDLALLDVLDEQMFYFICYLWFAHLVLLMQIPVASSHSMHVV